VVLVLALPMAGLLAEPQPPTATGPQAGAASVVDDFAYADTAAARAAWKPMTGSAEVNLDKIDGQAALAMPCNFKGTSIERASWDRAVHLSMTAARGLQFEFLCRDLSPIGNFNLFLHSGNGWYAASFGPSRAGQWCTVTIEKRDTRIEDAPAGWANIDAIRISAWRGDDKDTVFHIRNLRLTGLGGLDGLIAVIRGESVAATGKVELDSVYQYTQTVTDRLDELGLGYALIGDLDLSDERLAGKKLVILPHNPHLPDSAANALEKFLGGGGKVLAFYGLAPRLASAVGIAGGQHIPQKQRGDFASIRPAVGSPLAGMPQSTGQASWNIMEAKAVEGRSRVAGEWYDAKGRPTGRAAIVVSDNCIQMTHVLLDDDLANKRRLLLAMAGHLVPQLWEQAAKGRLDSIGRVGPYNTIQQVREAFGKPGTLRPAALEKLSLAESLAAKGRTQFEAKDFVEAIASAERASQAVLEAACMAQRSTPGEHRAFWCQDPFGVAGLDWDAAIKVLADNGFTDIHPNMCLAGVAYYKSQVLPVAPEVAARGDQIDLCLAACRKYGLRCHVWKINWNMSGLAPREFAQRMKQEGRMQTRFDGRPDDQWLCPSHPENRKLEIDSMVELATKYEVDGVHFDYIRYPDANGCFCAGCRERFEMAAGSKVENWPGDVRKKDDLKRKWLDFRRDNITAVVAGVSEVLRKSRPKVKISAAVFSNWPADRDGIGQDWKLWCEKGYLDFVCPMDYTPSSGQFKSQVASQVKWAGKTSCYPGIGLGVWGSQGDIFTLFEQIELTRQAGTGGFTIFNYAVPESQRVVPLCGLGITGKE
jgi:uncharacterized lipoprotein YddW (UPF0748 family)